LHKSDKNINYNNNNNNDNNKFACYDKFQKFADISTANFHGPSF